MKNPTQKPAATTPVKNNVIEFPIVRIGVKKSIAGMWPKDKAVGKN